MLFYKYTIFYRNGTHLRLTARQYGEVVLPDLQLTFIIVRVMLRRLKLLLFFIDNGYSEVFGHTLLA